MTEPPGNGHALALAAGQLMREPVSKILRQTNIIESLLHPFLAPIQPMDLQWLQKRATDRVPRVDGTEWVLKQLRA